jgi:hypothetical protein
MVPYILEHREYYYLRALKSNHMLLCILVLCSLIMLLCTLIMLHYIYSSQTKSFSTTILLLQSLTTLQRRPPTGIINCPTNYNHARKATS